MAGGTARGLALPLALPSSCLIFCVAVVTSSFDFVVKPEFGEAEAELNITTFLGQTGRLPCTVRHLAGKRVSWIRGRDLQVLSTGRITFSTDLRISVLPGITKFKSRRTRRSPGGGISKCVGGASNSSAGEKGSEGGASRWKRERCVVDYSGSGGDGGDKNLRQYSRYTRTQQHGHSSKKVGKHNRDKYVYSSKANYDHGRKSTRRGSHSDKRRRTELRTHSEHHQDLQTHSELHHSSRRRSRREHRYTHHFYDPKRNHKTSPEKMSSLFGRPSNPSDTSQSYSEYNSPIAIYPQGRVAPAGIGGDNKVVQPGPNYIEGVWEPEDYTLQIKYTKPEDAGTYLCQINTEPRVSQVVHLNVVKMRAVIVGSTDLFVKAGNPVTLSCRVNHGTLMPGFILWYKNELLVEYGRRVEVRTGEDGVSQLLLRHARPSDSANYTCSPSNGAPASLNLNVIVDERQAAMQQGNTASPPASPSSCLGALTGGLLLTAASTSVGADVAGSRGSSMVALGGLLWSLLPPAVPDINCWMLWSSQYLLSFPSLLLTAVLTPLCYVFCFSQYLLSSLSLLLNAVLTPLCYVFCFSQYLLSAALAPLTSILCFPICLLSSMIPFCYFCCTTTTATITTGGTSHRTLASGSLDTGPRLTTTTTRVGLLLDLCVLVGLCGETRPWTTHHNSHV